MPDSKMHLALDDVTLSGGWQEPKVASCFIIYVLQPLECEIQGTAKVDKCNSKQDKHESDVLRGKTSVQV
jgi:hypothetical protein